MDVQAVLPFVSTVIMVFFTVSVLERYLARRKLHFLFWGIGLAMFGAGSFAEAYVAAAGWSAPVFFVWYLFGAALNAGWIGHGTLMLLARRRWVHIFTALLVLGSLAATVLMVQMMPKLDAARFHPALAIRDR